MSNLVEFLLARITEDEETAQAASEAPWTSEAWEGHINVNVEGHDWTVASSVNRTDGAHIARWDPDRVLAECAAKRKVIAMHGELCLGNGGTAGDDVLGALALPYAGHPDCPEWVRLPPVTP